MHEYISRGGIAMYIEFSVGFNSSLFPEFDDAAMV